ncbi:MAG: hypothetical protein WCC69_09835 [Pirellulales bacterium]
MISNTLVPEFARSSVKPVATVTVPGLLPGRNDPSTASVLPLPLSVPLPTRSPVAGRKYLPDVKAARSNSPSVPSDRPPVPMDPAPETASRPPAIVVVPE